jgi:hypothetical protein
MTTTLYVIAVIAFIISAFSLKSVSEKRNEANHNLLIAKVLLYLSAIERSAAVSREKLMGHIPTGDEQDLLYERSKVSVAEARVVLSVLEDVLEENNIKL